MKLMQDAINEYFRMSGALEEMSITMPILMHLVAALDWDYAHIDEIRAFLKAPYKGQIKTFAKFRGGNQYFEILGALYGLKTAPRRSRKAFGSTWVYEVSNVFMHISASTTEWNSHCV